MNVNAVVITFSWDGKESHQSLWDPLQVTDTQLVSFRVLASVLSFSFISICSPISQSIRERRVSSSLEKIGRSFSREDCC